MNKIMETQKKIEEAVVTGYQKIEDCVVSGYKKIEGKFVDTFLTEDKAEPDTSKADPSEADSTTEETVS